MALSIPDASGVLLKPARPGGRPRTTLEPSRKKVVMLVLGAAAVLGAAGAAGFWWHMRTEGSSKTVAASMNGAANGAAKSSPAKAAPAKPVDPAIGKLEAELASVKAELAREKAASAELTAHEQELAAKAAEAAAAQAKLAKVVEGTGEVSQDGAEIHLQLVDKVLFQVGEAELTARGRAVLDRVGAALNDATLADKQLWVQGHTDDSPIRPARGVTPRFPSNWELSAARALTVVHYLQDQAKVDPRRLAAVAFGQYRPASRVKARNRRIEIVLYPHHVLK